MKKIKLIMMMCILLLLTGCASVQVNITPSDGTAKSPKEEQEKYVEDQVLSTDLFTITMPDEFKGKYLATVNGNEISLYDRASNEAGFGGFAFSVIADTDGRVIAGGMYTKVGEIASADGNIYDVCKSYPSDVQWDYTVSEEMPEDYAKLYNAADAIIETAQGNEGSTFMYGAGTKGEDIYGYVVAGYTGAFEEGWDANRFEEQGMSPEFAALVAVEGDAAYDSIGFAYKDITNDGVDDLLVGVMSEGDEPSVVYDVYTTVKRVPTLVASGTARNCYYAMNYGGLANVFYGGAMENGIRVYTVEPDTAKLFLQYGIKYDAYTDEKNPWFVSDGVGDEDDRWKSATEEEYNMWLERATDQLIKVDFTPFSEVMPIDYSKVDLSVYPTFTKMIDDFKKGMGYANVKIGDTDVFLVSSGTYTGENGADYAIDASVFMYGDDEILYLGKVMSGGTAYPLSVKDGFLYSGGHHTVIKSTVEGGMLVSAEEAAETFDADGNATYFYTGAADGAKTVEDDSELTRLFEEYGNAEPVEFATVTEKIEE